MDIASSRPARAIYKILSQTTKIKTIATSAGTIPLLAKTEKRKVLEDFRVSVNSGSPGLPTLLKRWAVRL